MNSLLFICPRADSIIHPSIQAPTSTEVVYYWSKMFRFVTLLLVVACTAQVSHGFAPILVPAALTTSSSRRSMVAVDTSEIKNGMTIELDGEPFKVLSFSIMKQARGAAKTTIKFKNLMRGTTIENTYRSGEKFETATIEKKTHAFTYNDEVR